MWSIFLRLCSGRVVYSDMAQSKGTDGKHRKTDKEQQGEKEGGKGNLK